MEMFFPSFSKCTWLWVMGWMEGSPMTTLRSTCFPLGQKILLHDTLHWENTTGKSVEVMMVKQQKFNKFNLFTVIRIMNWRHQYDCWWTASVHSKLHTNTFRLHVYRHVFSLACFWVFWISVLVPKDSFRKNTLKPAYQRNYNERHYKRKSPIMNRRF